MFFYFLIITLIKFLLCYNKTVYKIIIIKGELTMQDIYQSLNSDENIDELAKELVHIPGEELAKFLDSLEINLPRSLRFGALQKVLFPILEKEYNDLLNNESSAEGPERLEESRRQTRLGWLDTFSETQYENELFRFNNREIDRAYFEEMWKRIIKYLIKESVPKNFIADFLEKRISKYQSQAPAKLFNKALDSFICDEEGNFDGLLIEQFKKRVLVSATITELKQIGAKYGVKVPTRLTKIQVLDIIIKELKDREEYIPEVHSELNDFNLKELEEFARLNNIIAFAYINKDQMIDIMLDEYFETEHKIVHYNKAEDISQDIEAEPVIMPEVIEETVDESITVEENSVEEPKEIAKEEVLQDITEEVEPLEKEEPIEVAPTDQEVVQEVTNEQKTSQTPVNLSDESFEDLKQEIITLQQMVRELSKDIDDLKEDNEIDLQEFDKVKKRLFPRWFKTIILIGFFISLFLIIFIPLAHYYRNVIIVKQIADLLDKVPFFGDRSLLEFIIDFFRGLIN